MVVLTEEKCRFFVLFLLMIGSRLERMLNRVEVTDIESSDKEFPVVYNPGHPDADENGYVELPNVKILHEMVDMMTATRTYEANTVAVETTYQLVTMAMELGQQIVHRLRSVVDDVYLIDVTKG